MSSSEQDDPLPPKASTGTTRRRRKPLSCYACRSRKLRCDRIEPACGRCRKGGQAESCYYEKRSPAFEPASVLIPKQTAVPAAAPAPEPPNVSLPPAVASDGRQERAGGERSYVLKPSQPYETWQRHDQVLSVTRSDEQMLAGTPEPLSIATGQSTSRRSKSVVFRGRNFKTQYYGITNATSHIAHCPELRSFMRDSITHATALSRLQRDVKGLQVRWAREKANNMSTTDLDVAKYLPTREVVDHLVHLYFNTFENIYRILHAPSFWVEYEMFWKDPRTVGPAFIILLLLTMACVACTSTKSVPTYIGDSALAREQAKLWIEISEAWLSRQSQKHVYLGIWQIRCLLLLSKQVNVIKKKRLWTVAGNVVREAMSAGFHRDPSLVGGKVSTFDQEMRRRLWATMSELELQTSIDRGMPSAAIGFLDDNARVLNVNDEDLVVNKDNPPVSKPRSEFTSCSFLHISRASFGLRSKLIALGNDPNFPPLYEEVFKYEDAITKEIRNLPQYSKSSHNPETNEALAMATTLLDIQLKQCLILLHAPFAREADTNSRCTLSRMICSNAAASIIEQHSKLTGAGNYTLLLLRHEYFRAALILCHNTYISISLHNDVFHSLSNDTLFRYIESALLLLQDRISRLGTGYTYYWYISAFTALLRSEVVPQESNVQKRQAIDRVQKQFYRVLASQEELERAKEKLLPGYVNLPRLSGHQTQGLDQFGMISGASSLDASGLQTPAFDQTDIPFDEYYFGDPAAWTFETLWDLQ